MKYRFLTSGESHGKCLTAIIDGIPSNIKIDFTFVNNELQRRKHGYGRGGRMNIETDNIEIKSGVRLGYTTGAPVCLEIENKDFENWADVMAVEQSDISNGEIITKIQEKKITKLRPGHADFAGCIKYAQNDIRNILERSSARETAARVAVGAIAKCILSQLGIKIFSHVIQIGTAKTNTDYAKIDIDSFIQRVSNSPVFCYEEAAEHKMKEEIDNAQKEGTTLGGKIEVICKNVPVGLGSFVQWDRKIDGKIAQAIMSINAIKSVEIGNADKAVSNVGSKFHDEIFYENNNYYRKTNNAGGIEGGMTNGEDIVIKASMKPIPTMKTPLKSVDINTKLPYDAHFERSDVCAVPACSVVVEAMCAIVLVDEILSKFGGDTIAELKNNLEHYVSETGKI